MITVEGMTDNALLSGVESLAWEIQGEKDFYFVVC